MPVPWSRNALADCILLRKKEALDLFVSISEAALLRPSGKLVVTDRPCGRNTTYTRLSLSLVTFSSRYWLKYIYMKKLERHKGVPLLRVAVAISGMLTHWKFINSEGVRIPRKSYQFRQPWEKGERGRELVSGGSLTDGLDIFFQLNYIDKFSPNIYIYIYETPLLSAFANHCTLNYPSFQLNEYNENSNFSSSI